MNIFPTIFFQKSLVKQQILIIFIIFLCCCLGDLTRKIGYSIAFWLANPVALGLFLRFPKISKLNSSWILLFLIFLLTELFNNSNVKISFALSFTNFLSVFAGFIYLSKLNSEILKFKNIESFKYIFIGIFFSVFIGTFFRYLTVFFLIESPVWQSLILRIINDVCCSILVLPIILTASKKRLRIPKTFWPLIVLVLSEILSFFIKGSGILAFSVPAMLFCARSYGIFITSILNLLSFLWKVVAIVVPIFTLENFLEVISFRLGLTLISLGPLMTAVVYSLRNQLLRDLQRALNHDFLTGALSRKYFFERGQKLSNRLKTAKVSYAVMMLDLDNFKKINDNFGHAKGDNVLKITSRIIQNNLRPDDLFGRLGGEEFALILSNVNFEQSKIIAERLNYKIKEHGFIVQNRLYFFTISIGICLSSENNKKETLSELLKKADKSLYQAKKNGRNQFCFYEEK